MSAALRHLKKRWNDRRPESFSSGEVDSCCEQSSINRSGELNRSTSQDERFPVGTRVKKVRSLDDFNYMHIDCCSPSLYLLINLYIYSIFMATDGVWVKLLPFPKAVIKCNTST